MSEDDLGIMKTSLSASNFHRTDLINFGIACETLASAAMFATKFLHLDCDMPIKQNLPEDYYFSIFDSNNDVYFIEDAKRILGIMLIAIETSELKTEKLVRNFDGTISTEHTIMNMFEVKDWLNIFGHEGGDFWAEYEETAMDIMERVSNDVERIIEKRLLKNSTFADESETLEDKIANLTIKNRILCEKLSNLNVEELNPKPISIRTENTYQIIIGALLELLLGKSASGIPYSQFNSQSSVIEMIENTYGEHSGLSKRNLEGKFAIARRALNSRK